MKRPSRTLEIEVKVNMMGLVSGTVSFGTGGWVYFNALNNSLLKACSKAFNCVEVLNFLQVSKPKKGWT